MLANDFKNSLSAVSSVCFDEPMKKHTTFRIGGNADAFCEVKNIYELIGAAKLCIEADIDYMIIGNGSNMLVSDNGIQGVVIKMSGDFCKTELIGTTAVAGSGVLLSRFCGILLKNRLSGLEFAAGIPGSIGGGVFMNAGAYGGMLSDALSSVTFIDENMNVAKKNASELEFGYRHSYFTDKKCIICECEFALKEGNSDDISSLMNDYNKRRSDKQPLDMPSAGSVFKRPEGFFAGKLIQDSNLMGFCIGGASVSTKHAGFIVNNGNATAKDVMSLIEHIKRVVYEKYGVLLEEEIKLIGERL